jgi:PAS domain S-box-containing protein
MEPVHPLPLPLDEEAEQIRFAANAVPALITYVDTGRRYVWTNESYRRWFGHAPEEIRGRLVSEVLGPRAWAMIEPYVERALAGEQVTFDHRMVYRSGPSRDVRGTYVPHLDASRRVRGFVALINDITEIRGAEQALRRSERLLEQSQSTAHVGSWEVVLASGEGPDLGAVRWSDETYRIFGYEPGAVDTTQELFHRSVHPEDRETMRALWKARVERSEPFEKEYRIVRPDGAVRVLHSWVRFERASGAAPTRMIGTCQDVTERTRAEQELRDADRRKDEFLAMLSHELRNPLAPILNAIELLDRTGPGCEEQSSKYRAIIARQVRHMRRLLDDLLDVSRVSKGKINLEKEPLELGAVLLQAVEVSRPMIVERRQELSMTLSSGALALEADRTRLVQVFANLVNNAAKYTHPGGHIALTVTSENGEAVVEVRDDGVGITPELLARAFDLFAQGTRSLDRAQGGLGIGLTLVQTLVRMHGGSVTASSAGPGRGSEFLVRLPLAPAANVAEPPGAPSTSQVALRSLRVLLVDDNVDAAGVTGDLLELLGHKVTIAHDGPGALAAAAAVLPELVLLDIGLPGMDGYAVADRLRVAGHHGATLVALTGYGQDEHLHRSLQAGFDHHLVKPLDFSRLAKITARIR